MAGMYICQNTHFLQNISDRNFVFKQIINPKPYLITEKEIDELFEEGQMAYEKGDTKPMEDGYTENCILMMEGKDMLIGRESRSLGSISSYTYSV